MAWQDLPPQLDVAETDRAHRVERRLGAMARQLDLRVQQLDLRVQELDQRDAQIADLEGHIRALAAQVDDLEQRCRAEADGRAEERRQRELLLGTRTMRAARVPRQVYGQVRAWRERS